MGSRRWKPAPDGAQDVRRVDNRHSSWDIRSGKDAIAWLGERATEVKNLVFGAGVKAAQWIADTLSSTAADVQTAVGNAANAIAEGVLGTTHTIAESIMGFLNGTETNDNAAKAANSPPSC